MKKADYMIVGIALMLALVSFGVYRLYFASTGRAAIVEITVDGNVYKTLSLKEDATVDVPSDGGHTNTVQIKDGKVFIERQIVRTRSVYIIKGSGAMEKRLFVCRIK